MSEPIIQIRFSEVNVDRLNKAMVQIYLMLKSLQAQIDALSAALPKPAPDIRSLPPNQQAALAVKAIGAGQYPGIERGSAAIIEGPVPGGPSPIPPYITPHTMIVGEGSTPVKLLTFTNGQLPIGATGADPAAANITDSGVPMFVGPVGVAIKNGVNTITVGLDQNLVDWIVQTASFMQQVATILGISADLPDPNPPDGY